nr:hypothetical protein [Micromonospora avicenniae]
MPIARNRTGWRDRCGDPHRSARVTGQEFQVVLLRHRPAGDGVGGREPFTVGEHPRGEEGGGGAPGVGPLRQRGARRRHHPATRTGQAAQHRVREVGIPPRLAAGQAGHRRAPALLSDPPEHVGVRWRIVERIGRNLQHQIVPPAGRYVQLALERRVVGRT